MSSYQSQINHRMGVSSDEESEISESEIDDYSDIPYQLLQNGDYQVKVKGMLRCPFCSGKKKQNYKYKGLLAHASRVSKGSANRSAIQKANHLGLAKYMEIDLAGDAEPVPCPPVPLLNEDIKPDHIFVWPWMGIVVNPLKESDDNKVLLDSAYWLKRLSKFKPVEMNVFWVKQDLVVGVIANFSRDWIGFASATELEKEFDNAGYGRKEWTERSRDSESKAYGWCARAEDFNSEDSIGEYLFKEGKLRTFSDISEEIVENRNIVLEDLSNTIAMTNQNLNKVQYSYNKITMSLQRILDEKKHLHEAYAEETKKMQQRSLSNIQRILAEKERLSDELDCK